MIFLQEIYSSKVISQKPMKQKKGSWKLPFFKIIYQFITDT